MKTFAELIVELTVVKRGPIKHHMTATQKMKKKKLEKKKKNIQQYLPYAQQIENITKVKIFQVKNT